MILGHGSWAYVIVKTTFRKAHLSIIIACIIGSYFPDIIDKPVNMLGLGQGRDIGHTFIFNLMLVCLLLPLTYFIKPINKHKLVIKWFIIGAGLHLLGDFLEKEILWWPLYGPIPEIPYTTIMDKFYNFYIDTKVKFILVIECTGNIWALLLIVKHSKRLTWLNKKGDNAFNPEL